MQFNIGFIAAALLVAASPAMGATFIFYAGADCTGAKVSVADNVPPLDCIFIPNGGSAKSIGYSGVTTQIEFYESGGGHDKCTNGATGTGGPGSGCGTAPAGVNYESAYYF
ncbi:hypothetical protein B0H16DRAFT_1533292 [Mycena metata]|uniref:Uncharacterized protein n=1 Tax=Mycena metata TaxID=1033252 RepID=A0AAD7JB41_9AGAR|nr:hypothetical protein B0H16DRAFT_1533292 [Mycena metata]